MQLKNEKMTCMCFKDLKCVHSFKKYTFIKKERTVLQNLEILFH